jgi:hypothetical protein
VFLATIKKCHIWHGLKHFDNNAVYCLLVLFYLVFCIHAMKECGWIGGTTSLIRILITDELSGKLQSVAAVSLGKEPQVLV